MKLSLRLSDQVCTREQGEIIKNYGVNAESLFCFCALSINNSNKLIDILPSIWEIKGIPDIATTYIAPAFTLSELGNMLSYNDIKCENGDNKLKGYGYGIWKYYDTDYNEELVWRFRHAGMDIETQNNPPEFHSEVQAMAALVIYLLDKRLITPDQVNRRISKNLKKH